MVDAPEWAATAIVHGTLPSVRAKDLGGSCSGYGTGIGQTAAFEEKDCAQGVCLVDAREGLELYCSADCTKVACPAGYLCQEVENGAFASACFKHPGAAGDDDDDHREILGRQGKVSPCKRADAKGQRRTAGVL